MTLTCHYIDGSPFARMVRVFARELSLPLEEAEITAFPPPQEIFSLNPLGQAPILLRGGTALFPTEIALAALVEEAAGRTPALRTPDAGLVDRQRLAVILALGDQIAALRYRDWAGLTPTGPNRLGFDLDARCAERIAHTLDWLETHIDAPEDRSETVSLCDIALACLLLWTESRGPISWRGRPRIEALVARMAGRQSFVATEPRPWTG